MTYAVLFITVPPLGVMAYLALVRHMRTTRLTSPPIAPLFFVFAAYGAVLLFHVSEMTGNWSGMHSLVIVGLLLVGMPWLVVQGFVWRKTWTLSAYHRAAIFLSFAFPAVLASLFLVAALR